MVPARYTNHCLHGFIVSEVPVSYPNIYCLPFLVCDIWMMIPSSSREITIPVHQGAPTESLFVKVELSVRCIYNSIYIYIYTVYNIIYICIHFIYNYKYIYIHTVYIYTPHIYISTILYVYIYIHINLSSPNHR